MKKRQRVQKRESRVKCVENKRKIHKSPLALSVSARSTWLLLLIMRPGELFLLGMLLVLQRASEAAAAASPTERERERERERDVWRRRSVYFKAKRSAYKTQTYAAAEKQFLLFKQMAAECCTRISER